MLWLFIGVINDNNEVEDTGRKKLAILSPVLIGQLFFCPRIGLSVTL